jgi:uncharacterized protein
VILVVSDTSPIRALHHLGLLPVLGKLFERVVVPPAVIRELKLPPRRFLSVELDGYSFIEVRAPQDSVQVQRFLRDLDPGESEALSLAIEIGAEAVLMDEEAGRQAAKESSIVTFGTLGILLRAKTQGHLEQIRPLIDSLIEELDFFVSDRLKQEVLKIAGE